jgi:DNA-binding transcriptional MerR regulator
MAGNRQSGTYDLHQLSALVGVVPATIWRYARTGIIPKRAGYNRYTDEHLVRAKAARLLFDKGCSVAQVKARTGAKRRLAEVATLLPQPSAAAPPPPSAAQPLPAATTWERALLVPGLELFIAADAPPVVRRIAAELVAQFSASYRSTASN